MSEPDLSQLRESFRKASREWREARLRARRFLTAGNAGGLVATLSLLGTVIGNSAEMTAPVELFLPVVGFLFGLFCCAAALLIEYAMSELNTRKVVFEAFAAGRQDAGGNAEEELDMIATLRARRVVLYQWQTASIFAAAFFLFVSTTLSIVGLSRLIEMPRLW